MFQRPTQKQLDVFQKKAYVAYLICRKKWERKYVEERKRIVMGERWQVIESFGGEAEVLGTYDSYTEAKNSCKEYTGFRELLTDWGIHSDNIGNFFIRKVHTK